MAADTNRLRLILFNVLRTPPAEFSLVSATTIMAANRRALAFFHHIRSLWPDRRDACSKRISATRSVLNIVLYRILPWDNYSLRIYSKEDKKLIHLFSMSFSNVEQTA